MKKIKKSETDKILVNYLRSLSYHNSKTYKYLREGIPMLVLEYFTRGIINAWENNKLNKYE